MKKYTYLLAILVSVFTHSQAQYFNNAIPLAANGFSIDGININKTATDLWANVYLIAAYHINDFDMLNSKSDT